MAEAYDPLSYDNLAHSVVRALMDTEPVPLPPAASFPGPGVYALYCTGGFEAYSPIASSDCDVPIYVGKAVPSGGRRGGVGRSIGTGSPLYSRLRRHAQSLEQAANLCVSDFRCRHLVVVPVWVTLAERFLISHFRPVWNVLVDGFGNHDPGAGRRGMRRPKWDIVHPGRPWAARLEPVDTAESILDEVASFFRRGVS